MLPCAVGDAADAGFPVLELDDVIAGMEKRDDEPVGLFAAAPLELPPNMLSRDISRVRKHEFSNYLRLPNKGSPDLEVL